MRVPMNFQTRYSNTYIYREREVYTIIWHMYTHSVLFTTFKYVVCFSVHTNMEFQNGSNVEFHVVQHGMPGWRPPGIAGWCHRCPKGQPWACGPPLPMCPVGPPSPALRAPLAPGGNSRFGFRCQPRWTSRFSARLNPTISSIVERTYTLIEGSRLYLDG